MHLYSGLHSFLNVHMKSTGCYSGFFHLDESTSKFLLLAASHSCFHSCSAPRSSLTHSCSARQTSLSLSLLLCLVHFSCPVLVGLANFFLSLLFFCLPTVVYKIDQRQTYHKPQPLLSPAFIVECLGGENIEDGCDQVHCNIGDND